MPPPPPPSFSIYSFVSPSILVFIPCFLPRGGGGGGEGRRGAARRGGGEGRRGPRAAGTEGGRTCVETVFLI